MKWKGVEARLEKKQRTLARKGQAVSTGKDQLRKRASRSSGENGCVVDERADDAICVAGRDADGWISRRSYPYAFGRRWARTCRQRRPRRWASVSADGDGMLCEAEFFKLALQSDAEEEERNSGLKEAFGLYEMKGEGCITPASLGRMLGRLGNRFDLDGDDVLSFDEFKILMSA